VETAQEDQDVRGDVILGGDHPDLSGVGIEAKRRGVRHRRKVPVGTELRVLTPVGNGSFGDDLAVFPERFRAGVEAVEPPVLHGVDPVIGVGHADHVVTPHRPLVGVDESARRGIGSVEEILVVRDGPEVAI